MKHVGWASSREGRAKTVEAPDVCACPDIAVFALARLSDVYVGHRDPGPFVRADEIGTNEARAARDENVGTGHAGREVWSDRHGLASYALRTADDLPSGTRSRQRSRDASRDTSTPLTSPPRPTRAERWPGDSAMPVTGADR